MIIPKLKWCLIPIFLSAIFLMLLSCSGRAPMLDVLEGNSRYGMGDYAGATVNYMQALYKEKYKPWIYYNLGNAYSALGEIEPAIAQYEKALGEQASELQFQVNFNLGNLYYELGEYGKAVSYYKDSLRAKANSMDAKFNLELAEKKYSDNLTVFGEYTSATPGRSKFLPPEMQQILEQTRRKEETVWKELTEKRPPPHIDDW